MNIWFKVSPIVFVVEIKCQTKIYSICHYHCDFCFSSTGIAEANGLIALRIFGGLGEGVIYAGLTDLLAAWVPLKERTTLASLAYGGSTVSVNRHYFLPKCGSKQIFTWISSNQKVMMIIFNSMLLLDHFHWAINACKTTICQTYPHTHTMCFMGIEVDNNNNNGHWPYFNGIIFE